MYSSPRRGIEPGLSRVGRGYWSLYYRGIPCLEFFVDTLSPNAVLNKILKLKRSFFSSTWNWVSVSRVTGGDTHHYTTEELRYSIICGPFFSKFPKVFSNEILNQKKCIHVLGAHLNPGLSRDRLGYSSLYYRGITCFDSFVDRLSPNVVLNKSWSKKDHSSYRRGIEFRSPAWQAGMPTTILPRNSVSISFAYHFSTILKGVFK